MGIESLDPESVPLPAAAQAEVDSLPNAASPIWLVLLALALYRILSLLLPISDLVNVAACSALDRIVGVRPDEEGEVEEGDVRLGLQEAILI